MSIPPWRIRFNKSTICVSVYERSIHTVSGKIEELGENPFVKTGKLECHRKLGIEGWMGAPPLEGALRQAAWFHCYRNLAYRDGLQGAVFSAQDRRVLSFFSTCFNEAAFVRGTGDYAVQPLP